MVSPNFNGADGSYARAWKPSERRRHGRMSCEISLTGKVGSQQAEATALDLSVTGARVVLPGNWANSREVALSGEGLRLRSTIRAQVVWVTPMEDGKVMAGLHFLEDPTQLEATWAHLHLRREGKGLLRRRRYYKAIACERTVGIQYAGRKSFNEATMVSLSAAGGQFEVPGYTPLGSNLCLELPFEDGRKQLRLRAQVVHQQKRGQLWRMSLQFLLADDAREHPVLQRILAELQKERPTPASHPLLFI